MQDEHAEEPTATTQPDTLLRVPDEPPVVLPRPVLKNIIIPRPTVDIDRITPTQRPDQKIVGYQTWRDLLFLHWPVSTAKVQKLLPPSLTVDTFDGTAYIGIVPFAMENVKPWWLPKAFAFNFLETNLRTYVHHNGRPGVYFFSLEAASWLAVQAARWGWQLPYYYAGMRMDRKDDDIEYELLRHGRHKAYFRAHYTIGDKLGPSQPGTLEHFLLERYLLFTQKGRKLLCGQVHHKPYPAFLAHPREVQEELVAAAGLPATQGPPTLAHFSPGVDVDIFPLLPV